MPCPRFKIDTESPESEKKLQAAKQAWDMGAKLKSEDVMDLIGFSKPNATDEILLNPQIQQQQRLWDQSHQDPTAGGAQAGGADPGSEETPSPAGPQEPDLDNMSPEDLFGPLASAGSPAAQAVQYARRTNPIRYKAVHAPKGGATVGGKKFVGGQFIPQEDLAKASPQELQQLSAATGQNVWSGSEKDKGDEGGQQVTGKPTGGLPGGGPASSPGAANPRQAHVEQVVGNLGNKNIAGLMRAFHSDPEYKRTGTAYSQDIHPQTAATINAWLSEHAGQMAGGGKVVDLGNGRLGFASAAGSVVLQKPSKPGGKWQVSYTTKTKAVSLAAGLEHPDDGEAGGSQTQVTPGGPDGPTPRDGSAAANIAPETPGGPENKPEPPQDSNIASPTTPLAQTGPAPIGAGGTPSAGKATAPEPAASTIGKVQIAPRQQLAARDPEASGEFHPEPPPLKGPHRNEPAAPGQIAKAGQELPQDDKPDPMSHGKPADLAMPAAEEGKTVEAPAGEAPPNAAPVVPPGMTSAPPTTPSVKMPEKPASGPGESIERQIANRHPGPPRALLEPHKPAQRAAQTVKAKSAKGSNDPATLKADAEKSLRMMGLKPTPENVAAVHGAVDAGHIKTRRDLGTVLRKARDTHYKGNRAESDTGALKSAIDERHKRSEGAKGAHGARESIGKLAAEHGFNAKDLNDAIDFVKEQHDSGSAERDQAREAARLATGFKSSDIAKFENQGIDYSSKHPKMNNFTDIARTLAGEFPAVFGGQGYEEGATNRKIMGPLCGICSRRARPRRDPEPTCSKRLSIC